MTVGDPQRSLRSLGMTRSQALMKCQYHIADSFGEFTAEVVAAVIDNLEAGAGNQLGDVAAVYRRDKTVFGARKDKRWDFEAF